MDNVGKDPQSSYVREVRSTAFPIIIFVVVLSLIGFSLTLIFTDHMGKDGLRWMCAILIWILIVSIPGMFTLGAYVGHSESRGAVQMAHAQQETWAKGLLPLLGGLVRSYQALENVTESRLRRFQKDMTLSAAPLDALPPPSWEEERDNIIEM